MLDMAWKVGYVAEQERDAAVDSSLYSLMRGGFMATLRSKEKALSSDAFSQKALLAELDDPILNRIAANIRKTRKSMRESRPLFEKLEQIVKGKA